MKKLIIILALSNCLSPSFCQTNISEKLTRQLEEVYAQGHIVGFSVAIVDQNGLLYSKGFGFADLEKNIPYTENTIQNIASISKTFIGVALLKAQELGKLNLDDPVNEYLPFRVVHPKFPDYPITIRHLTTHTSGITDGSSYDKYGYVLQKANNEGKKIDDNFRQPEEMMSYADFLRNVLSTKGKWYSKKAFLKSAPGKKFEYSNIGAGLAALALEGATGQSFESFTEEHIFKPLNMINSGWHPSDVDSTLHTKHFTTDQSEIAPYYLVNFPDGGVITSSSNLGRYLSELIAGYNGEGKVLTKECYATLFQPQLTEDHFEERSDKPYNDEYNMGIFMGISAKDHIGHTGGDPGVATFMFFNYNTGIGKLMMINTNIDNEGVQEFFGIWEALEQNENKF